MYLRMLARALREGFDATTMAARINQLAALIRTDLNADTNKIYTIDQFETSLASQVRTGQTPIYGLGQFVTARYNYLRPVLNSYAQPADLRINELMSASDGSVKDAARDADPWLELFNLGPGTLSLSGYYLTDDPATPRKWALTNQSLTDGGFLVLWLDNETAEGTDHASFRLAAGGATVYLYNGAGGTPTLIDSVTYPALATGRSYVRLGWSGTSWATTSTPTAGTTNSQTSSTVVAGSELLRINELMADNGSTVADPDEAGAYEDWVEIYNPGTTAVDMGGLCLTDDLAQPNKWQVPAGVTIPAGGYAVFWADDEGDQGLTHAGFKISASGEAVGLYQSDGTTQIDAITFDAQTKDVSYCRYPDGAAQWTPSGAPTPGAANKVTTWIPTDATWVPVASHGTGANQSMWRTDLGVLNPGTSQATVELSFQGTAGTKTTTFQLAGGTQVVLDDVVQRLDSTGSGTLRARSDQEVLVTSRTYNLVAGTAACSGNGTLGQDYPSYASTKGLEAGESAWLPQLTENAQYRTNIALSNAGTSAANANVTLYNGAGVEVGSYAVELAPGERQQVDRAFVRYTTQSTMDRGYAKVAVTAGDGVIATASVVDNVTNDPTTVTAIKFESEAVAATNMAASTATSATSLRINELMADNDSTMVDPDETGAYEDWIEIYNSGTSTVDIGGMYLTDDLADPTKWQIPQGVTVPAGGFVVFWADDDEDQGLAHAGFKLSADGEAVGLYQSDGSTLIDSITFGAQNTDVSFGRYPDGGDTWSILGPPTPGAANRVSSTPPATWLWLPVASHADGANESKWRTDLGVLNAGANAANVEVRFHAMSDVKSSTALVPAGTQLILVDVVDQLGATGSAALEIRADQEVLVTSRSYNQIAASATCAPNGTLGQSYASYTTADGLGTGQHAWLPQLAENAQYRTNISLTNTGTIAASITVTLYNTSGVEVGSYTVELAAGEWKQDNRPFALRAGQNNLASCYAKIAVTAGSGVVAVASVVDNITNDPTTVRALR
jgi:hypothetical protein